MTQKDNSLAAICSRFPLLKKQVKSCNESVHVGKERHSVPYQFLDSQITLKSRQTFEQSFQESLNNLRGIMNNELPKIYPQRSHFKKLKTQVHQNNLDVSINKARSVLLSGSDSTAERENASHIFVESIFMKVYGEDFRQMEVEKLRERKDSKNKKCVLDLGILEQILSEIERNPRSHSINIRKSQLNVLKSDILRVREEKEKGEQFQCELNEEGRLQAIYKIKNQYSSLKPLIIPSICQDYDSFLAYYSYRRQNRMKESNFSNVNTRRNTFLLTSLNKENKENKDLKLSGFDGANVTNFNSKMSENLEKFKAFRNSSVFKQVPSKFEKGEDHLIMQNINDISPCTFLFFVNHCRFQKLRVLKLKSIKFSQDLLFFFFDCMRYLGSKGNKMECLQLSSIAVENAYKLSEKVAAIVSFVSIRSLRFESLQFGTRQFTRIVQGLLGVSGCEQISFRHNRIDILGVRVMENVCRHLRGLKSLDMRNNDIPHYANLKDKNPVIQFF